MLQVAAYCRVSTDKEDQANSFEAQQRYFREYIQRQPDWELQGIYADEGFSGTSTNKRVEFNKMLHALAGRCAGDALVGIDALQDPIRLTLDVIAEISLLGLKRVCLILLIRGYAAVRRYL